MTKVDIVDLNKFREEGERRIPYSKILLAAEHFNTSPYMLPGPNGYLSPSTIAKWRKCPHAVYRSKIARDAPFYPGLAMTFGNANHEGCAVLFSKYRDKQKISAEDIHRVVDQYLATVFAKLIPEDVLEAPEKFVKKIPEFGKDIVDSVLEYKGVGIIDLDDVLAILKCFQRDELNPDGFKYKEIHRDGKTMTEFFANIDKRRDESRRIFTKWIEEKGYTKFGKPKDIQAIEEDIMVIIDGIPIYFIADLVTAKGVYDWKFTSASMIEKRRSDIPGDMQLWLYELVYSRPGHLALFTPPPKKITAKTKERDLPVVMGRQDKGQLMLTDADFVDIINDIPRCIDEGWFEKRGQSFLGGCGFCEAYEICSRSAKKSASLSINKIKTLKKGTSEQHVDFDKKAFKAQLLKDAEDGSYSLDNMEDE